MPRVHSSTFVVCGVLLALASASRAGTVLYETCGPDVDMCPQTIIPDYPGAPADLSLFVPFDPAGANTITGVSVRFWIQHPYQGDLLVEVMSPAGTVVPLVSRPGGGGFSTYDFGGWINLSPTTRLWRSFDLYDTQPNIYDVPVVAYPGLPGGFRSTAMSGSWWRPVQPLSLFHGENKVGTWHLRVTDQAAGDLGMIRYFGVAITSEPPTPAAAVITSPNALSCACNQVQIMGTADDADGTMAGYVLEWASNPQGPYNQISSGTSPVVVGLLGTWDTSNVPEGHKFVRLTVTNGLGQISTFSTTLVVDRSLDLLAVREAANNAIVGGAVCMGGDAYDSTCFASYRVDYAPAGSPNSTNLMSSASPVLGGSLATISTTGGAFPDGNYTFVATGTTTCGNARNASVNWTIDNTPPVALISSPSGGGPHLNGIVTVVGTVSDAHMGTWKLDYQSGGGIWRPIATGSGNVINGVLGSWNTTGLPPGAHTLRLVASDASGVNCGCSVGCATGHHNEASMTMAVNIGLCCDINRDGAGDGQDTQSFVNCLLGAGSCP